jgi:hypothetical protein
MWGLEVYRPGTLLAGDARHSARQEGWSESPLDGLQLACGGDAPRKLAAELVALLNDERGRLLRLAVRRQGHHLTLVLNVPDSARFEPRTLSTIAERLAERVTS